VRFDRDGFFGPTHDEDGNEIEHDLPVGVDVWTSAMWATTRLPRDEGRWL
jgi:hypothetical protein